MSTTPLPHKVLLHFHLFKNAGTTLDWSLARSFREDFCEHRDDEAMRGHFDYLMQFLSEHPNLKALSSHWLPLPPNAAADFESAVPVAMLRDPIDRIASVYRFERRQEVEHPGTDRARRGDLSEYVQWRLSPKVGPVIRNFQARMLSGTYPGPDDDGQLELARQRLNSQIRFGLVHRYDESMCLLEHELQSDFPGLDLAYQRQNVSDPADGRGVEERRDSVFRELGEELSSEVMAANSRDQRLFAEACDSFESRWAALPNREERLLRFRERCQSIKGGEEA